MSGGLNCSAAPPTAALRRTLRPASTARLLAAGHARGRGGDRIEPPERPRAVNRGDDAGHRQLDPRASKQHLASRRRRLNRLAVASVMATGTVMVHPVPETAGRAATGHDAHVLAEVVAVGQLQLVGSPPTRARVIREAGERSRQAAPVDRAAASGNVLPSLLPQVGLQPSICSGRRAGQGRRQGVGVERADHGLVGGRASRSLAVGAHWYRSCALAARPGYGDERASERQAGRRRPRWPTQRR